MHSTAVAPDQHQRHALRRGGIAMLIAASVLWSLSGLAVKLAAMDPLAFAMWRSLAGAVALGIAMPFVPGRWPRAKWMAPTVLVYTAVVTLLLAAMTLGTAARGILLQYTGPVFCALFAWLFQGRRIGAHTAGALLVAAVGIAAMIAGAPAGDDWVGPTCGLLSGVAFGALILLLEKVNRTGGGGNVNAVAVTFLNNAGAAAILVLLCLATRTPLLGDARQMAIVTLTGVVQLAIPYALFQIALKRVEPVDASLLILLEPVLNPIWVAFAVGEHPDWATVIGGVAILAAMVIEALKPAETREDVATNLTNGRE